ncbi:hypothetical protein PR202_gb21040 [Eleusine coracana subsp. coracana]|uniref:Fungal lipase-like domain-containing protein n=1 Tax=Eleusine coracana subsp. coracana TaxID=191504 RepID=A0AAV5FC34_ELECO|nr:hypothetical protein PR202_gb21040 [Eleusine coracana subsp. coracana]
MGSNEVFAVSGPKHMMTKINWNSEEHRRCIAACLVNGTYIMEHDGYRHRRLAPAWWESFQFRYINVLRDDDAFIFGAIFEYVPPNGRHPRAPRYIVAFRGTIPLHFTGFTDMHLNLKYMINKHHDTGRYRRAREQVGRLLDAVGNCSAGVWLAGHSLGACIALDVGRHVMERRGCGLPTFLFNPPHVSLAPVLNKLRMADKAKRDLYITSFMVKAALAKTVGRALEKGMAELFDRLAPWVPELYVHEKDFICQGFIDYFEQRQRMLERSRILRPVAEVAMRMSFRDMWISLHKTENGEEPRVRPHLLPSARLWKNSSEGYPHGLEQWWQPDSRLNLRPRQYIYHGP